MLQGENGFSRKSDLGQASYYYSQPFIDITGTIWLGGESIEVTGQGWLDREWSSQPLADNQDGWDWVSLHLSDGSALIVYQLRHDSGDHYISGSWEAIELEIKDHIMTICLNRPDRKNAINATMGAEIIYALDYAKQERSVRVVVLKATGDVFCAGGDLAQMSGQSKEDISTVPVRGGSDDIALRFRHLNKPSIACVQGNLFAGALLFLCNMTHAIAAEGVKFSAPEIKRGIWPFMVMGGLFRIMPKRAALDFVMRGNAINTAQAEKWGRINEAVPAEALTEHVALLAKELTSRAPSTMRLGLAAYVAQDAMEFDEALPYLREQLDACLQSDDAKEGITAFLEKRQPVWG